MKQMLILLCCISILVLSGGCVKKEEKEKRQNRDFTICTVEQTPDEVKKIIENKKKNPFQFTYSLQEYMYIVVGYGEQKGGGYSIEVVEFTEDREHVYVNTNLLGSDDTAGEELHSYPYIVIKCVKPEKNIIFL